VAQRLRQYMACILVLETGIVGVFCSLDLVLFYVFWEVMLIRCIPDRDLGGERRIYAAVKFILYTMAGSLLMLVAILYCFYHAGSTFDWVRIHRTWPPGRANHPERGVLAVLAFLLAFAIKCRFSLPTWLPDAHVKPRPQAP